MMVYSCALEVASYQEIRLMPGGAELLYVEY